MIASLPMYWRPETARLWRDFWHLVQYFGEAQGLNLPALTAPEDVQEPLVDHWLRQDLVLSMACGLPFRTALPDRVTYVGTLGFGLSAPDGHYFSRVIVNAAAYEAAHDSKGDLGRGAGYLRDPILAYNSADSQSGWAASQSMQELGHLPRYGGYVETGSHAASLDAVATGRADIAFLDAVTWRLLKRYDPKMTQVRLVDRSASSPALPLITAKGTDPAPLRATLSQAVMAFQPEDPLAMGGPLSWTVLSAEDYFSVPLPAPPPSN